MANFVFNKFKEYACDGTIDMDRTTADSFKVALYTDATLPAATVTCKADLDGAKTEVANGNGYTTGGITLTGISCTVDNVADQAVVTWNNVQWTASGGAISASGAIIFDDSTDVATDDETDAIISYKDAGGTITATDGTPIIISSIKETLS